MAAHARNAPLFTAAAGGLLAVCSVLALRLVPRTGEVGLALLVGLLAGGLLLTLWSRWRVARPLQRLAEQVEAGVTPDLPVSGVREIATLHRALVRLDRRVAEREAVLRAEREDAETLGRFAEVAQQATSEAELYGLLVRFLEMVAEPAAISLYSLGASMEKLGQVYPLHRAELPLLPALAEPVRCRAVRSARDVHFARGGDPGSCDCPLARSGAALCLPLRATGQVIGLVSMRGAAPGHFEGRRGHLAQALAATASTALNSIRLLARSRDNAIRDALTQAYNRRFLSELLPKLVNQAARAGTPLSALMIDVDRFKAFNDRHGHDAGDRILAAVARCLAEQIREADALVRYGGEEFAVLLPNTPPSGALVIAERLREAVASLRTVIPQADRPLAVTISVGAASIPENGASGEVLLQEADRALYRAKEAGRNGVMAASGAPAPLLTALA